jgi:nucleotide-binding universal stress UspA family protein
MVQSQAVPGAGYWHKLLEGEDMSETPRYHKIVVPLDGSGWSKRAVPHAVDIARTHNAELILLHVLRPPAYEYVDQLSLAGQDAQLDHLRDQMKQYLIGIRNELRNEKVDVRCQVIEGTGIAHLVCEFVNNEGVDLVVMSTHGRSGITEFLFGSVANKIMQCLKVPVLLVHPDKV